MLALVQSTFTFDCLKQLYKGDLIMDEYGWNGKAWIFIPDYDGRFILETKNLKLKL